ncbi:MAG: hypothetical protein ACT6RL_21475 [Neoaquamicrobium sediminum]|uniref:hypothetical protein n=1 Tax=Neoaquamicrobium sediminum TaxID=1849104 RepID=UPI0040366943
MEFSFSRHRDLEWKIPAQNGSKIRRHVTLRFARIIGRRMARWDFEKAMQAANDNSTQGAGARKDGADED